MNTKDSQKPTFSLEEQATQLWWQGLIQAGLIEAIEESSFRLSKDLRALWRELRLSQKFNRAAASTWRKMARIGNAIDPVTYWKRLHAPKVAAVEPTDLLFSPRTLDYAQLLLVAELLDIPTRRKGRLFKQAVILADPRWEAYTCCTFGEIQAKILVKTGIVRAAQTELALELTPPTVIPTNIDPI